MSLSRIYLSPPDMTVAEETAVSQAVRSGWVAPLGPELEAFENDVAEFVGVTNAVALSSGTAALHLALKAVGVVPGDSVITSTMTFVATANAITYVGARPVFVDTLNDGTLDPFLVQDAIEQEQRSGKRVGALVPVDIYGRLADYPTLLEISASEGIPLVADAAESLGASRDDSLSGSFGDAAVVSFNGNKIMTTSGGGMFLSDDPEKASYVRYLATQAREPFIHYEHVELGFNYRLSNVSAALGRAQLARLPEMIARRREIRRTYLQVFQSIEGVTVLTGEPDKDNCWLTCLLIDPNSHPHGPLDLLAHLEQSNIESRPLWKPMHMQPLYRNSTFIGGNNAENLFRVGLALPSGSSMDDGDLERVVGSLKHFFGY